MSTGTDRLMNSLPSIRRLIVLATAAVLAAQAVAGAAALVVSSSEKSGIYPLGTEVVFTIGGVEPDEIEKVHVTIQRDGFEKSAALQTARDGATLKVRFTPEAAGWYVCEASAEGTAAKDQPGRAGVMVAPETIAPSIPAPDDFDGFWNARKAALKAMAATAELKSVESPDPTIECFDLTIPCPQTKAARGYYARPRDAKARRCPAILYLRAAGVAGHWCKASAQNAASLATEYGAIVVDINAHGMLNGQPPEYYQDLEQGELRHYPTQGADDRDKFYFVGMYVRLLAAIEFIAAQEPWDGAHLVTTGESQGGGQALAAAGLDRRVSAVVAIVPAMCDFTGPVVGRLGGWPMPVGRDIEDEHTKKVIEAVRYCDNVHLAARSRAETLIFVGLIDTACPPPGIFATYNTLPGPKQIVAYPHKPHNGLPEEDLWLGDISTLREAFILRHIGRPNNDTN